MGRKEPTLKAKLAAALRELFKIPYEHAKLMTDEQVLSLFQWQHIHYHSQNRDEPWVDAHWNLEPLLIGDHKEITAKVDLPQIGKTRRITKAQEEFRQRLLTPRDQRPPKKRTIQSRGFQKRGKQK